MMIQLNVNPENTNLDTIIQIGVQRLIHNMKSFPSFDPSRPYEEKNYYISGVNEVGLAFLSLGYYSSAEKYYTSALETIRNFEKEAGKNFNKGIVYANLGIVQIRIGKFDAGIAHLLAAEREDHEVDPRGHSILNTPLWWQFEAEIFQHLKTYSENSQPGLNFPIEDQFLKTLFQDLDARDRIFLQGTILTIFANLGQHRICANVWTYGRLFTSLRDICLLIETLLRKKQRPHSKNMNDLGDLLPLIFENMGQKYSTRRTGAGNWETFLKHLEAILAQNTHVEMRWANCVHLVRNYAGHHFSVEEKTANPEVRSFFNDLYEDTFDNIMCALMFFKHISAI